jgi:hypothetical protein
MNTDQVLDLFAGPARPGGASADNSGKKDGPKSRNEILAG